LTRLKTDGLARTVIVRGGSIPASVREIGLYPIWC